MTWTGRDSLLGPACNPSFRYTPSVNPSWQCCCDGRLLGVAEPEHAAGEEQGGPFEAAAATCRDEGVS